LLGGFSFYTVYGNDSEEMIFSYYPKGGNFMYILVCIVNGSIASFIPFYIIANMEILENFASIKNWLYYEDQTTNRYKLALLRVAGTIVTGGCSMVSDDVTVVTGFAGSVFMPLISFLLPIIASNSIQWTELKQKEEYYAKKAEQRQFDTKWLKLQKTKKIKRIIWYIHDGLCFCVGIGLGVYGLYSSIVSVI